MVTFKSPAGRRGCLEEEEQEEDEVFDEQNYIQALGADNATGEATTTLSFSHFLLIYNFNKQVNPTPAMKN